MTEVEFGFLAGAADAPGVSDADLYNVVLDDVDYHVELGYKAAWIIEHHFSDYYPTPNPLQILTYLAARHPQLELGTSVLVTPWYDPLRLAEDIAVLSLLTDSKLHLGVGRGTAKFEYDAFGLNMDEGRDRFRESIEIVRTALGGDYFTYDGELLNVPKRIRLRPRVDGVSSDRIKLYGAIGSPSSAAIMAKLGLPPICTSVGDTSAQRSVLDGWRDAADENLLQSSDTFPIMINCIVADTDAEAIEQAQEYIPGFMQAQLDHYTPAETDWEDLPSYQGWRAQFEGMKSKTDPANIPGWTKYQLIGSPETVAARTQEFVDIGFNHFILHAATPGVPHQVRREWTRRYAQEVIPMISSKQAAAGILA